MRATSIAALALAGCALLGGCKRELKQANLDAVKPDMNPKEVESILGQPNHIETTEMPLQADAKTLPVVRYIYDQNGKTVTVHFVDGKLIGLDGTFDR